MTKRGLFFSPQPRRGLQPTHQIHLKCKYELPEQMLQHKTETHVRPGGKRARGGAGGAGPGALAPPAGRRTPRRPGPPPAPAGQPGPPEPAPGATPPDFTPRSCAFRRRRNEPWAFYAERPARQRFFGGLGEC